MPRDITTMHSMEHLMHLFPRYISVASKERSLDLAYLLSKAKTNTLDFNSASGFREITTTDSGDRIPGRWKYLTCALPKRERPLNEIVEDLISGIKACLLKTIRPQDDKLFIMSGGADSRILSWILTDIRNEYGNDRLGNIQFVCHHPEGEEFLATMLAQGWSKDQYRVHKHGQSDSADYYDYGNFDYNMNGYIPLSFNFWSEVVKAGEEQRWVWISGGYGGEMLQYPIDIPGLLQPNRYQLLRRLDGGFYFGYMHIILNCQDILFPYLGHDVLDTIFSIPDKYYVSTIRCGQKEGAIRAEILNKFKDATPCHRGHAYNFTMTEQRKTYIRNKWHNSKFFKRFHNVPDVAHCDPTNPDRKGYGNKLYSLATCYERVEQP